MAFAVDGQDGEQLGGASAQPGYGIAVSIQDHRFTQDAHLDSLAGHPPGRRTRIASRDQFASGAVAGSLGIAGRNEIAVIRWAGLLGDSLAYQGRVRRRRRHMDWLAGLGFPEGGEQSGCVGSA